MSLRVLPLVLGPFAARSVLVADPASRQALVVDPGFDAEVVVAQLRRERLEPTAVVLTHGHVDHACGVGTVASAFPGVRTWLHAADWPLYEHLPEQAAMFGFPKQELAPLHEKLEDGQVLAVGGHRLLVRHAPGHSPGHVVLLHDRDEDPFAIVGDVLFAGAVGRTDLWGGSFEQLERSIREVLYVLPGPTRVIPGHGDETTIAMERESNPFVAG